MNERRHLWQPWVDSMYKWGINDLIASFLEAAGPLNILVAQAIYMGKPLVVGQQLNHSLATLADMLENSQQTQAFISFSGGITAWTCLMISEICWDSYLSYFSLR
jgi:hypothetical protein